MTTYTAITDSEIDADSPITVNLMTLMRDNPIALSEGATGAPRIKGEAMLLEADLDTKTIAAADTYTCTIGTTRSNGAAPDWYQTNSTTYILHQQWIVDKFTGTARFTANHKSDGVYTSTLHLTKNGSTVNTWTTTSTTFQVRTEDVAVVPTDTVLFEHKISNAAGTGYAQNGAMKADGNFADTVVLSENP